MEPNLYQPLYALIQSALWSVPAHPGLFAPLTPENWEQLFQIARSQGVYGIISDSVFALPPQEQPPKSTKLSYGMNIESIQRKYDRAGRTAARMADEFAALQIPMMLMKGLGLAAMYPHPQVREFGDLDIYLFGHYKEGNKMAREQGAKVENERGKHSNYFINGIPVENHQYFLNVKSFKIDRILEPYLKALMADILHREEYLTLPGPAGEAVTTRILLPSPTFNALFFIRHALTHLGSENMVLRHLCDWACFLSKYSHQVDWTEIKKIFDQANITRFCESFTYMACRYIGMPAAYALPILQDKIAVEAGGKIVCRHEPLEELSQVLIYEIDHCPFFVKDPHAKPPKGLGIILYKCRRIAASKWKYDLIYTGGSFWREKIWGSVVAHVKHPESIFRL